MSEVQNIKYSDSRELADFDAIFMDPILSKNFQKMRNYNEILEKQPIRYEELLEIVNEIDVSWRALLGESAELTGFASFLDENDHGSQGEKIKSYYENQKVAFKGATAFSILSSDSMDDAIENPEHEHYYELTLGFIREGIDDEATYLKMHGSAKINEIIGLEFENTMSTERAIGWLSYYYPDIIEDIDVEILNEAQDECERILKLAEYEWSLNRDNLPQDENFVKRTKAALEVYIGSLFNFDMYVGYGLQAKGEAWLLKNAHDYIPIDFNAGAIATILGVSWEDAPSDNTDVIRPHLKVLLHDDDMDEQPITMMIPVKSIEDLYSIRTSFHQSL